MIKKIFRRFRRILIFNFFLLDNFNYLFFFYYGIALGGGNQLFVWSERIEWTQIAGPGGILLPPLQILVGPPSTWYVFYRSRTCQARSGQRETSWTVCSRLPTAAIGKTSTRVIQLRRRRPYDAFPSNKRAHARPSAYRRHSSRPRDTLVRQSVNASRAASNAFGGGQAPSHTRHFRRHSTVMKIGASIRSVNVN